VGYVIFFVGNTGGCQDANAVGSGLIFDLSKPLGDQIYRLIPRGFPEGPVFLNQGSGQSFGIVDEIESKPALDTQAAVVGR